MIMELSNDRGCRQILGIQGKGFLGAINTTLFDDTIFNNIKYVINGLGGYEQDKILVMTNDELFYLNL